MKNAMKDLKNLGILAAYFVTGLHIDFRVLDSTVSYMKNKEETK